MLSQMAEFRSGEVGMKPHRSSSRRLGPRARMLANGIMLRKKRLHASNASASSTGWKGPMEQELLSPRGMAGQSFPDTTTTMMS